MVLIPDSAALPCASRDGVWALCIDVGTGYRVYCAVPGKEMVLLCGGDKRMQAADIGRNVPGISGLRGLIAHQLFEDGDQGGLLTMLRQMTKAFGGVQTLIEQAHLNPT